MGAALPPEHEQRIAALIEGLGNRRHSVYRDVNLYAKGNDSAARHSLVVEGTTVADQVRRVYWHYARADEIGAAMKEAAKVAPDIENDLPRDHYKLKDLSNG
jgi:hypothetical protein